MRKLQWQIKKGRKIGRKDGRKEGRKEQSKETHSTLSGHFTFLLAKNTTVEFSSSFGCFSTFITTSIYKYFML